MSLRLLSALFLAGLLAAGAAPARAADDPPYEPQMLRLAEVLGSLHYLRGLCGGGEAGEWRDRMGALLDAESPTIERREKLAGAFNRGYRAFQQSYVSCTEAANVAVRRYLEEGQRLTREMTSRYAN